MAVDVNIVCTVRDPGSPLLNLDSWVWSRCRSSSRAMLTRLEVELGRLICGAWIKLSHLQCTISCMCTVLLSAASARGSVCKQSGLLSFLSSLSLQLLAVHDLHGVSSLVDRLCASQPCPHRPAKAKSVGNKEKLSNAVTACSCESTSLHAQDAETICIGSSFVHGTTRLPYSCDT